ncbi:MAG: adenylate/guanylate cyclase domain-containing protein [Chloroflexi bacterium]|nr:adenylate/guanylate cyclase domain-containing protein [Chloroflexota bacterium]
MPRNPTMCGFCARDLRNHPGGAEIELSVLFAVMFIPAFTGEGHAGRAVDAARNLLQRIGEMPGGLPVGIGVHTGTAFAGAVGTDDQRDVSALGDAVNVAARLGSMARANRILLSVPAARAAGSERRWSPIGGAQGRQERLDVVEL